MVPELVQYGNLNLLQTDVDILKEAKKPSFLFSICLQDKWMLRLWLAQERTP